MVPAHGKLSLHSHLRLCRRSMSPWSPSQRQPDGIFKYDLKSNDDITGMVGAGEPVDPMPISPPPELTPCLCACIGLPRAVEGIREALSVRGQGGSFGKRDGQG